jgi:hypothetical protein
MVNGPTFSLYLGDVWHSPSLFSHIVVLQGDEKENSTFRVSLWLEVRFDYRTGKN